MLTVTVVRKAGVDKYGDPLTPDTRFDLDIIGVAPRQDPETRAGIHDTARQGIVVGLTLYAPFDVDLRHTDQIEIGGAWSGTWEIEGEPGNWQNPFDDYQAGLEVALRRASG